MVIPFGALSTTLRQWWRPHDDIPTTCKQRQLENGDKQATKPTTTNIPQIIWRIKRKKRIKCATFYLHDSPGRSALQTYPSRCLSHSTFHYNSFVIFWNIFLRNKNTAQNVRVEKRNDSLRDKRDYCLIVITGQPRQSHRNRSVIERTTRKKTTPDHGPHLVNQHHQCSVWNTNGYRHYFDRFLWKCPT